MKSLKNHSHDSDKLTMHTDNLVDSNIEKIAELFPNCITESQNEQGELERAIDFELLKQELSHQVVDGSQERYRLDWVGKRKAILEANTPIAKTLRPMREESVNFDSTENLFIEGDNLDALKLLQESYLGKVKMIYIDPPYNTGNDFIYEDDFAENTQDFLQRSEQIDENGNRLIANTESNGRFHSDWLTMMYSRLKLARNLLSDDGVLVASIDDSEIDNLKKILFEVFGGGNHISTIIWSRKRGKDNSAKFFSRNHEYLLFFAKNISNVITNRLEMPKSTRDAYKNPDNDSRGDYRLLGLWARGTQGGSTYSYTTKDGYHLSERKWLVGKETMIKLDKENKLKFNDDKVYRKFFIFDYKGDIPETIWANASNAANAADEIKKIMGNQLFDTVKPLGYLNKILKIISNKDDLILDFFAGSATTAHAVMDLNAQDGGKRKFIMVQLPEITDEKSEAHKAGYSNIAEISKERIRRAGQKIVADNKDKDGIKNLDIGFRVLKVDSTNMKDVYYRPDEFSQKMLMQMESNIKDDRTAEDLLFQVMLDWGVSLDLPITSQSIQGQSVYCVGGNSLVASFEAVNADMIDDIAKLKPLKFVSCERAIQQDQDKSNIKERFRQLSPTTDVKFI